MGGWESASRWLGYFREGQRKGAGEGTREAERGWNLGEELAAAGGGVWARGGVPWSLKGPHAPGLCMLRTWGPTDSVMEEAGLGCHPRSGRGWGRASEGSAGKPRRRGPSLSGGRAGPHACLGTCLQQLARSRQVGPATDP